jgi:hypothetical protein
MSTGDSRLRQADVPTAAAALRRSAKARATERPCWRADLRRCEDDDGDEEEVPGAHGARRRADAGEHDTA